MGWIGWGIGARSPAPAPRWARTCWLVGHQVNLLPCDGLISVLSSGEQLVKPPIPPPSPPPPLDFRASLRQLDPSSTLTFPKQLIGKENQR